jgi:D-alanyl-D-alanine carboxypeptidase
MVSQLGRFYLRIMVPTLLALLAGAAHAGTLSDDAQRRLLAGYPEHLERIEGNTLIWRDGTRMPLDDGKGDKTFADWLEKPDIEDTLSVAYPAGDLASPPPMDSDPGRARNAAFFDKVYGDCRKGEVEKNLTTVVWLPLKTGQRLPFNKANGAAQALQAVSAELDALPARFDVFLYPSAGTYNCRAIAGTKRMSAHGHAIAIDIALKRSDYWRNVKAGKDGAYAYKNEIPMEIVRIFESHGFIWGGKWHHYDTMHFEYRPELIGRGD